MTPRILIVLVLATWTLPAQDAQEASADAQAAAVTYRLRRHPKQAWIQVTAKTTADAQGSVELNWPDHVDARNRRRYFRGDQIQGLHAFADFGGKRLRVEYGGDIWFVRARPFEPVTFVWSAPPHLLFPRRAPASRLDAPYFLDLADVLLRVRHHAKARHEVTFDSNFGQQELPPLRADRWRGIAAHSLAIGALRSKTPQHPLCLEWVDDRLTPALKKTPPFDPKSLHDGLATLLDAQTALRGERLAEPHLLRIVKSSRRGRRSGRNATLIFERADVIERSPRSFFEQAAGGLAFDRDRATLIDALGGLQSPGGRNGRWLIEGAPTYLGLLTLRRAGFLDRRGLLTRLQTLIERSLQRRGVYAVSGREMGWLADDPRRGSDAPNPFEQGALLAFCLDSLLRVDAPGTGLSRAQKDWPILALGEPSTLTSASLRRFAARHLRGSAFPPVEEAFARFGYRFRRHLLRADFKFEWTRRDGGFLVTDAKGVAGLNKGDFVLAVNGREDYQPHKVLETAAKKRTLTLKMVRGKRTFDLRTQLRDRRHWLCDLTERPEADTKTRARREAWLRGPQR